MPRTTAMRSEKSWSLLDPKPIVTYLAHHDDYIVHWNGIVIPHSMALCMAMEQFGIWPTPEMKTALESNYRTLYYAGAFDTRAWDTEVEESPIYPYLKRIMAKHLPKAIEGKDAKEVLGWFHYNRARKEEHV
jgi:hypothetical protein